MPVVEIKGDLLESDCNVIAHCANAFCTMGSGVAKAIRAKYPEAYLADCMTTRGDRLKMGTVTRTVSQKDGRHIFNLYAQYNYGTETRQVDYEMMYRSLQNLKQGMKTIKDPVLALPRLGSGLAGGDWHVIKAMIEATFPDEIVYVYYL